MASSPAYDELQSIITCPVCFESFEGRNSKLLSCFHAFCCECLQRILDDKTRRNPLASNTLCCPVCTCPTIIPGGNCANLPAYFHVSTIQSVMKQLHVKQYKCEICESVSSKLDICCYCLQCGSAMCANCKARHDQVHPSHKLVSVSGSSIVYLMCKQHNKHVEYYCLRCMKTICNRCHINEHLNHFILDIVYDKIQTDDFGDSLKSNLQSAKEKMDKLVSTQSDFNAEIDRSRDDMENHYTSLVTKLDQQYESFCMRLQEKQDSVNERFDTYKEQVQHSTELITKIAEVCSGPVQDVAEAKLARSDQLLSDIKSQILDAKVDKPTGLIFKEGLADISLGIMVEDVDESLTGSHDQSKSEHSTLPVQLWSIPKSKIIAMSFLSEDVLIAVGHRKGIKLYAKQIEVLDPGLSGLQGADLCDISAVSSGLVIGTIEDNGSEKPGYLHALMKDANKWQHDVHGICKMPIACAVTQSLEFIVTDRQQKMYKYDKRGQQIWCRPLPPLSHAVCVDNNDRILVCHKHNVAAYDENGTEIATFSLKHDSLDLCGICVNTQNQILVGDLNSESVLLFDVEGNYIKHLIKVYGRPRRLALYGNKYLAVRLYDGSNKMSVYRLE